MNPSTTHVLGHSLPVSCHPNDLLEHNRCQQIGTGFTLPNTIERQSLSNRSETLPSTTSSHRNTRNSVPARSNTGSSLAQQLYASAFTKPPPVNTNTPTTLNSAATTINDAPLTRIPTGHKSPPVTTPFSDGRTDTVAPEGSSATFPASPASPVVPASLLSPRSSPLSATESRHGSSLYSGRSAAPSAAKASGCSSAALFYGSYVSPRNTQGKPSGHRAHLPSSPDRLGGRAHVVTSEHPLSPTSQTAVAVIDNSPCTSSPASRPQTASCYSITAVRSPSCPSSTMHTSLTSYPSPPTTVSVHSSSMSVPQSATSFASGLPSPPISNPTSSMTSLPSPPSYNPQPLSSQTIPSTTGHVRSGSKSITRGTNVMAGLAGGAVGLMGAAVLAGTLSDGGDEMGGFVDGMAMMTTGEDSGSGSGLMDSLSSIAGGEGAHSQPNYGEGDYQIFSDHGVNTSPSADTVPNYFQDPAFAAYEMEQTQAQEAQTTPSTVSTSYQDLLAEAQRLDHMQVQQEHTNQTNLQNLIHEAYQQEQQMNAPPANPTAQPQYGHSTAAKPPSHSHIANGSLGQSGSVNGHVPSYQPNMPSGRPHASPMPAIGAAAAASNSTFHTSSQHTQTSNSSPVPTVPTQNQVSHRPISAHPTIGPPLMNNTSYQNYAGHTPNNAPIHQTSNWQAAPTNQPAYYNGTSVAQAPVQPLAGQQTVPQPHTQSTGLSASHIGGLVRGAAVVGGLVMGMVNNSD